MSELPPEQEISPVEQRLLHLLDALRGETQGGDGAFVGSVMRQVRVQSLLRELLGAVGVLTSAVREALAILLGSAQSRESR